MNAAILSVRLGLREGRGSWQRLLWCAAALLLGIAAMVAARILNQSFASGLDLDVRGLLGADAVLSSKDPIPAEIREDLSKNARIVADEVRFRSMIMTERGSHFVLARLVEQNFPFYGTVQAQPADAWPARVRDGIVEVLVDEALAQRADLQIGSELNFLDIRCRVRGIVARVPGDSGPNYGFAPRIFVPRSAISEAAVTHKGMLADFYVHAAFLPGTTEQDFRARMSKLIRSASIEIETTADRRRVLGEVGDNISGFLSLVSVLLIFLGGLGALSALQFYLRQKRRIGALMRCLGASGFVVGATFLSQLVLVAALTGLAGGVLGCGSAYAISRALDGFVAVPFLDPPWLREMAIGICLGVAAVVALVLPAIVEIASIPPLEVLRPGQGRYSSWWQGRILNGFLLVLLSVLAAVMAGGLTRMTAIIVAAALGTLLVSSLSAFALRRSVRMLALGGASVILRHALRGLDRPGNQTFMLLSTFGAACMILGVGLLSEEMLSQQAERAAGSQAVNAYLFDVQSDQRELVRELVKRHDIRIQQEVPTVLMRLTAVKGRSVRDILDDENSDAPRRSLTREYWSTYRAEQAQNERVIGGEWVPRVTGDFSTVPVSIEDRLAERLGVGIGDSLNFDVGGIAIEAKVTSIRDILWERLERNSFLVFPEGALHDLPQFFVFGLVTESAAAASALARDLRGELSNVTLVDVRAIVATVEEVIADIGFALRAVAIVLLFVGAIVLCGSMIAGRAEREMEAVLMRTVGARKGVVRAIYQCEYALLALLGSGIGIVLALAGGWLLSLYVFKVQFAVPALKLAVLALAVPAATWLLSALLGRRILSLPPAAALREAA